MYTTTDRKTLVLIGAGSAMFTRGLVQEMIADGGEWELRLVDINRESLEVARRLSERLVEAHAAPIVVRAAEERRELLAGADAVVTTIGVGGRRAWEQDVFVPRQFGIYQPVGDTYMPGGISRALRSVPPMVDIANDVAALCPAAIFINYSNPMSVICRAIYEATSARVVGLCIGVKEVHDYLAHLIDAPPDAVWSAAIGVNHLTWITELRYEGRDAWPLVRQRMAEKPDVVAQNPLSWDLFQVFGAFPAVLDRHVVEFFPGWHGERGYYGRTLGVDAIAFEPVIEWGDQIFERMADEAYGRVPLAGESEAGEHSQLVEILRAVWDDAGRFYSVNLPNAGQASNLPPGAVLEGTTLVNGSGFHPLSFGELPPGISGILQRVIGVQELTVAAALSGDRQLVVQAMLADGHVLTRERAEALTDALLEAQREWLPHFHT
jgi:alpha-galactosidase